MTRFPTAALGIALLVGSLAAASAPAFSGIFAVPAPPPFHTANEFVEPEALDEVVQQYCTRCHSERRRSGNLVLADFDLTAVGSDAERGEKMVRKLRAGMMPPSSARQPGGDTLVALMEELEQRLDAAAEDRPNPGSRTFQRLNRAEYAASIHQLLGLEIDPDAYLPPETMSGGFDNIADAQRLSPTLMDAYLNAASEISRLAVGDEGAVPAETTYEVSRYGSQREWVPGAPMGSRGGVATTHVFPADGDYVFKMSFHHESTGNFFGATSPFDEMIEVSVDGERVALLDIDRWMHVEDPEGVNIRTEPIHVTAGPHQVAAAFVKTAEGPVEDLMSPHEWSLADRKIGYSYGITSLPHLQDFIVSGPYNPDGVSDSPVRQQIFTCRPQVDTPEDACPRSILERLARQAYRRPVGDSDIQPLLALYEAGVEEGGFEVGVRTALQGVLASPDFLFRFEEPTTEIRPGATYPISDIDLASRLSFFLWSAPPDETLIARAEAGELSDDAVLESEVRRMLADPKAQALGSRFAGQWLRLQDLEKVHPDKLMYPDYDQQLADALIDETETFFNYLVQQDRSVFELLTAEYTFTNERLAKHYGFKNVAGSMMRMHPYPDEARRGLLGHSSILTLTSHAARTSPVLRGKWVMEVFLGSPPPPPPPDVPELEETAAAEDGKVLSVRERLEMHAANPTCNACHRMMDPIGLALENFDVTGRWRLRDGDAPVDAVTELYDGQPIEGVEDLRQALLNRPEPLVRTFAENLMTFATGRRMEYTDMPAVRKVAGDAAAADYRLSAFIMGVVKSPAFRMAMIEPVVEDMENPQPGR